MEAQANQAVAEHPGFDLPSVRAALTAPLSAFFRLHYVPVLASTQDWLAEQAAQGPVHGWVCVADQQTAGRGRSGRLWQGGKGENLQVSIAWQVAAPPNPSISLACGVAVVEALRRQGVSQAGLKWPNDIMLEIQPGLPAKLGGVLVETRAQGGACVYRIGLGLNFRVRPKTSVVIDQPVADLRQAGYAHGREEVLAGILTTMHAVLGEWEAGGFEALRPRWEAYDVYRGQQLEFDHAGACLIGEVVGLDADGAIGLKQTGQPLRYYHQGEIRFARRGAG